MGKGGTKAGSTRARGRKRFKFKTAPHGRNRRAPQVKEKK